MEASPAHQAPPVPDPDRAPSDAATDRDSEPAPIFEPVPPLPPSDSGTTASWAELVHRQHGNRRVVVEPGLAPLQLDRDSLAPDPPAAAEPAEEPAASPDAAQHPIAAAGAESDFDDAAIERIDRRIDRLQDEVLGSMGSIRDRLDDVAEEVKPRLGEIESELESSIAVLFEQIGRIDDKLASTENEVRGHLETLQRQVAALEAAFEGALNRLDEERQGALEAPRADRTGPATSTNNSQQVVLNAATFEDLRRIGLSVTQAARVIAYRDTHGGFTEIGQLREVRGLSSEDLQILADRASL